MKELTLTLSMKDRLSSPLGKAGKSVQDFSGNITGAMAKMGAGAAGIWAVGKGLMGVIAPADSLRNAFSELSTRGVGEGAMKQLAADAAEFSTDFGVSAESYIKSVTEIRSSIAGLADEDLPAVSKAVNLLAGAMQSSGADAAAYIARMSNTFQAEATAMGNVDFAESIASKTAWLLKNTGQDMAKMQGLLEASKGAGNSYGVGMDEQLVVLGTLGQSMGSAAGGAYAKLLKGAAGASKELGISLTDAQGQLLSMPDILDKLQAKFGTNIAGNAKLQMKLNKAFGAGAPAINKLLGSSEKLRKNIAAMQSTTGSGGARDMATALADYFPRMEKGWERIKVAFGSALLPVIDPVMEGIIQISAGLARWMEMFPNIARWIGYIAGALGAFGLILSVIAFFSGVRLLGSILGLGKVFQLLRIAVAGTVQFLWRYVIVQTFIIARTLVIVAVMTVWMTILGALTLATKLWGAATMFAGVAMQILTSPITLIILAIAALVAGIALAIIYWDEIKAAIMDTEAFRFVSDLVMKFGDTVAVVVDKAKGLFAGLWQWLTETTTAALGWLVDKLNMLPGVNIDMGTSSVPNPPAIDPPAGVTAPGMKPGGIAQSINNSTQSKSGAQIGQVNIYPQNQETFNSLMESRELAAP
ncbi:TPA: phage tail tape measure protein [Enterobacter kobei]|nr:phage tail tape measure protein [Enterobacter kobei]